MKAEFDFYSFAWCITKLCDGMPLQPDTMQDYRNGNILLVQDHVATHCKLCTVWDFPALAVIEMAETYANFDEKIVDEKTYRFHKEHFPNK